LFRVHWAAQRINNSTAKKRDEGLCTHVMKDPATPRDPNKPRKQASLQECQLEQWGAYPQKSGCKKKAKNRYMNKERPGIKETYKPGSDILYYQREAEWCSQVTKGLTSSIIRN